MDSKPEEIIAWLNSEASDKWREKNIKYIQHATRHSFASLKFDHHCVERANGSYCGPEDGPDQYGMIIWDIERFGENGIDPHKLLCVGVLQEGMR
jgi:hypothetical protein